MFIRLKNALMPRENQQVLRLRQTYLMRRFLLIALGMGFLLPTAVSSETIWLVLYGAEFKAQSYSWQVPTASKQECEEELARVLDKKSWSGGGPYYRGGLCLKGK